MSASERNLKVLALPERMEPYEAAVLLNAIDDVAIAWTGLKAGMSLVLQGGEVDGTQFRTLQGIPAGHKVAVTSIDVGAPVRRYGQMIGIAAQTIRRGEHVHTHNLSLGELITDTAYGVDVRPVNHVPEHDRRSFLGYRRANGWVGARNTIAIISTVTCSAHAAYAIAHHFTPERLEAYAHVDGVIALAHSPACSMRPGGQSHALLKRTLTGMALHRNVGAALFVGLGCELCQADELVDVVRLAHPTSIVPRALNIQALGGMAKTVEAGISLVEELLPQVNEARRTPQPISELMLALQCGGSDGWSGITANPILGFAVDQVVRQGGTAVLSETPEIHGAENLLTRRAASAEIAGTLVDKVRWWEAYTQRLETGIDNNPTPGNMQGGLTTIYEKALGAVAKGGSTPLRAVYDYAEQVRERGLVFMDGPGYDPVSVTGQVAGGCNLVLFTTGRGSVLGFRPAPCIKIASNSALYYHMKADMDFDAGRMAEGSSAERLAAELLDLVVAVASGQPSKSEAQGMGEAAFMPWTLEIL